MRALALLVMVACSSEQWEHSGDRVAEPIGVHAIAVVHEDLDIDLRPLADGHDAEVNARYRIVNRGADSDEPLGLITSRALVFVRLDGNKLTEIKTAEAEGKPTAATRRLAMAIRHGEHVLDVETSANPIDVRSAGGGTRLHKLTYTLGPAHQWGELGDVSVTVTVPPDWSIDVTPALVRDGDTLRGQFKTIPDELTIATQAPPGLLNDLLRWLSPILAALVFIGGGFVLVKHGWRAPVLIALGWGAAAYGAGWLFAHRTELALPDKQSAYYGIGNDLLLMPFAIVAGLGALFGWGYASVLAKSRRGSLRS